MKIHKYDETITDFEEALDLLKEGNERFKSGELSLKDYSYAPNLKDGQNPFAIIVGCSDSRVVPEIIFDQKLGDLFIVRTGGNVIGDVDMGSIEYAANHLNPVMILVLGHEGCGAIGAFCEEMEENGQISTHEGGINSIATLLKPSIKKSEEELGKNCSLTEDSCDKNINEMINLIKANPNINHEKIKTIGAKYFWDGHIDW